MDIITAMQGAGIGDWVQWVAFGAVLASVVSSMISAAVPDSKLGQTIGKVLNVLALNIGKARNDPSAQ